MWLSTVTSVTLVMLCDTIEGMKIIVMQGLPGSGKSTEAKHIAQEDRNTVRVNRDLLREMAFFGEWKPQNEEGVIEMEKLVAEYYLGVEKRNVIIDDTNLTIKHEQLWNEFAEKLRHKGLTNLEIEFRPIKTDVYTCIERDSQRAKKVGPSVIYQMALENGLMDSDINYILCDLDGTLCDIEHRRHYVKEKPKNWKGFFADLPLDTLRKDVYDQVESSLAEARDSGKRVFLMLFSARPENYRSMTEQWLKEKGVDDYAALIMRRAGDSREDSIVKRELLHKYFKDKNKIIKVFDDRPRVIRMWREEGLEVVDVGDGVEF